MSVLIELDSQLQNLLNRLFLRLRGEQFNLSMSEYLAALEAVKGVWSGESRGELAEILKLLWCSSRAEQAHFQIIWESVLSKLETNFTQTTPTQSESEQSPELPEASEPSQPIPLQEPKLVPPQPAPEFSPLPVKTPFIPAESEEKTEFQNYWPVSRRSMVYSWRYLRRPEADGPEDVLDIPTTVERAAEQGFFLAPIFRKREINHAHLLLLIDQNGSMMPFHRFSRDLVETAQYDSTISQVDVFYFRNAISSSVYQEPYLTTPIALQKVLAECDSNTSVLIVSDGGAARGNRLVSEAEQEERSKWLRQRIRLTAEALFKIRQYTSLIAWLNPMSKERWEGTAAQMVALSVPMFQLDRQGLSNAIDVVRGQPFISHQ